MKKRTTTAGGCNSFVYSPDRSRSTFDRACGGSITREPAAPAYQAGSNVTLTAVADVSWSFTGWEGALSGNANPSVLIMDADKLVTARFDPASGGGGIRGTVWYDANMVAHLLVKSTLRENDYDLICTARQHWLARLQRRGFFGNSARKPAATEL